MESSSDAVGAVDEIAGVEFEQAPIELGRVLICPWGSGITFDPRMRTTEERRVVDDDAEVEESPPGLEDPESGFDLGKAGALGRRGDPGSLRCPLS